MIELTTRDPSQLSKQEPAADIGVWFRFSRRRVPRNRLKNLDSLRVLLLPCFSSKACCVEKPWWKNAMCLVGFSRSLTETQ
jgi:hypothetical protein